MWFCEETRTRGVLGVVEEFEKYEPMSFSLHRILPGGAETRQYTTLTG